MDRSDWWARFLIGIVIGVIVLIIGCAVYDTVTNVAIMSKIVNGYVVDKNYRAAYSTQNIHYNGSVYYYTTTRHPASYTLVVQSDEDSELIAHYSVSAGKYELYDIGDYIENVNKTLGYYF